MSRQENILRMVRILEGQIKELNEDLLKVEHFVSEHALKLGIAELEESLKIAKSKLN